MNDKFIVTTVSREDVRAVYSEDPVLSKIAEKLTDEHMKVIANKLGDFCLLNWTEDIKTIMENRILDEFECEWCGEIKCVCEERA